MDPESMVGKSEKGVTKLISNAIIMLVALVALPTLLFGNGSGQGLVYRAQNAFLPMLPRLLLGINENSGVAVGNGNNGEDIEAAANVMAVSSLQAFFIPASDLDEKCGSGTYDKTPAITKRKAGKGEVYYFACLPGKETLKSLFKDILSFLPKEIECENAKVEIIKTADRENEWYFVINKGKENASLKLNVDMLNILNEKKVSEKAQIDAMSYLVLKK